MVKGVLCFSRAVMDS